MDEHYNAFISYKHAPLDTKVAERVQFKLEHFRIPAKIRKSTGIDRIQRVFRDKDELPITSNLTDTISKALDNSDYLIVICSHSTKESVWVKREIQFFLKTHPRNKILAVLAEGEPSDVLPPELLHEEVRVLQADGSEAVFLQDKEPLCCDYRGKSLRKADKQELPRLVAALIGCSYDELMNRRRAYQMQRITVLGLILAVLSICFCGYMLWNNAMLEKSYRETLINQSIYLSNESEKLLKDEKRIEAIQLALAALPSDEVDRPLTAEAVRALSNATLAYTPLSGTNIHSVWNYKASTMIRKMTLSPEHTSFAVSDITMMVTVWNTESHEVIFEKSFAGETIYSLNYCGDQTILITTRNEIFAYNLKDGRKKWSLESPESSYSAEGPIVCDSLDSLYIVSGNRTLFHLSTENGDILDKHEMPFTIDNKAMNYDLVSLSPDETRVAASLSNGTNACYVGVLNLSDDSLQVFPVDGPNIRNLIWVNNDSVVISEYDIFSSNNLLRNTNIIVQPHTDLIRCVDVSTMTEKWKADFTYNVFLYKNEFLNLPARNAVAYATGDVMNIYDVDTGEVIGEYQIQQVLVDISDNDGDGTPTFVTETGGLGGPVNSIGNQATTYTYEFVSNISDCLIGDGVYVLQENSNEVLYYNTYIYDEEWTEIDENVELTMPDDYYFDDDYLVVKTYVDNCIHITAYDANKTKLLYSVGLPEASNYSSKILGIYDDELYVSVWSDALKLCICRVSMEDGEVLEMSEISNIFFSIEKCCSMSGNFITYMYNDTTVKGNRIRLRDLTTGKEEKFVLPLDEFDPNDAPKYFPDLNVIYYNDKAGNYLIDVENHEIKEIDLPKDWAGTTVFEPDADGDRWIIADMSRVLIFNSDGEQEMELLCGGISAIGATFYKQGKSEQILVVFDDGSFYRYDAKSGDFIGKTEVETYTDYWLDAEICIDEEQGLIFIQTGQITDIVDMESWIEVSVVWNSFGYHKPTDRFLAFSFKSKKSVRIGYFRHYTLDDLIDKAEEILNGAELSPEQKSRYGIS